MPRNKLVFYNEESTNDEKVQDNAPTSRESSQISSDSVLIKTKSGGFFQRKKTFEKSLAGSERSSVVPKNDHQPVLSTVERPRNSHPLTVVQRQNSTSSEQLLAAGNESYGLSKSTSVNQSKRNSNSLFLKTTLNNISKENSLSLKPSNSQKDEKTASQKNSQLLNFPKFNIQSLNKMNNKANIFQIPNNKSENGSPVITQRQGAVPKSDLLVGNSYYLKTQNKNAINGRTAARFFQPSESTGNSKVIETNRAVQSNTPSLQAKVRSTKDRSFALHSPSKEVSLEASHAQGGSLPRRTMSKLNMDKIVPSLRRDQSPQAKEATYLLNQSNHAFKKARSRQFKNSILHNVFINPNK